MLKTPDSATPIVLRKRFEDALVSLLNTLYPVEAKHKSATRYALEGSGKRVRPLLCMLATESLGGDPNEAIIPSLAIEMIHTYSLVHDDLPCMDNDSLRRGRPTVHVAYDPAQAVLAGDNLLTDSFKLLSSSPSAPLTSSLSSDQRLKLIELLSKAAGSNGMVHGQLLDIYWTDATATASMDDLMAIHQHKTGKLLAASCAMGAVVAGAKTETVESYWNFGESIGLAFQIIDDILDDMPLTGKTSGKDREQGKLTFLSHLDKDEASDYAKRLTDGAASEIKAHSNNVEGLITFAQSLLERQK